MIVRRFVAVLLFLAAPVALAEAPGVFALTGATVHPVSGPEIANGIVIIRGGLIEAVGASVPIPADATLLDLRGAHVYPGLIDAQTFLGFATPKRGEKSVEPTADSLAIRNAKISDDDAAAGRAIGVTTVLTAPAHGIFNGQSAIVNLGNGSIESRVVKSPASLQIAFNTRPTWTYPDSLMGVMAFSRQSFLDAQQHAAARAVYDRNPAGLRRPPDDPALDALQTALARQIPVVFVADSASMIRRALTLAKEHNLRLIIAGARQAYSLAPELKGTPVLVSVKWDTPPADKQDREDQPLRVIRDRQLQPTTPSVLAAAGVEFALVSSPGKAGDFLPGIRKAIENGLTAEQALRATTLTPARIFGIDRQLGSLERGKIANVIVSDKPLFEKEAKVTRVFVDGRDIRLPAEEKVDEKTGEKKEVPATPIDGTWSLTIRAPQGSVAMQVTLTASGGKLTGTYSGDRGSGNLRGGTFDGTTFEFTISVNTESEAEASDWVFRGTVAEKKMSGTVTTTLGSFELAGSKSE